MTPDTLTVALVGIVGTVLVAVIGFVGIVVSSINGRRGQLEVAKTVIAADRDKLRAQLHGEALVRAEERRRDHIRDAVAEILAQSDPEGHARISYASVVALIQRVELTLRLAVPHEARINAGLSALGHALQRHHSVQQLPMEERQTEVGDIWRAQSEITEGTRALLQSAWPVTP